MPNTVIFLGMGFIHSLAESTVNPPHYWGLVLTSAITVVFLLIILIVIIIEEPWNRLKGV